MISGITTIRPAPKRSSARCAPSCRRRAIAPFEELGECLLALGRQEEARPWFAKAHQELSKDPWLVGNEPERLARLEKLGPPGSA